MSTLSSDITNNGTLNIIGTIVGSSTVTNNGTINTTSTGKWAISYLVNNGNFINYGTGDTTYFSGALIETTLNPGSNFYINSNNYFLLLESRSLPSPNSSVKKPRTVWNGGNIIIGGGINFSLKEAFAIPSGSLLLNGGTLTIDPGIILTVNGYLTNNSNMLNNGTIINNYVFKNNSYLNSTGTLINNFQMESYSFTNNGTFTNVARMWNNREMFNNGTITNNSTASLHNFADITNSGPFINNGYLNNDSSASNIYNYSNININTGSVFTTWAGKIYQISGSNLFFNNSMILPVNNIFLNSGSTITIGSGSNCTLNDNLILSGGENLVVNGTLLVNAGYAKLSINSGTLTNTGTLTIKGTVTNKGTVSNTGTINLEGNYELGNDIAALPGGVFNWDFPAIIKVISNCNLELTNTVTIPEGAELTVETGSMISINPGAALIDNYGGLKINGGTLVYNTNADNLPKAVPIWTSYTIRIAAGVNVNISNYTEFKAGSKIQLYGTLTCVSDADFAGSLTMYSGSKLIIDSASTTNANANTAIVSGSSMDVYGNLNINNLFDNLGTLNLKTGGTLLFNQPGIVQLSPTGIYNWDSPSTITIGAQTIFSISSFNIPTGITMINNGTLSIAAMTNYGTLNNYGSLNITTLSNLGRLKNYGSLDNGIILTKTGYIYNYSSGSFTIKNNITISIGVGDTLTNYGNITLNNFGKLSLNTNGIFDNQNMLHLAQSGILILNNQSAALPYASTFDWGYGGNVTIGEGISFTFPHQTNIDSGRAVTNNGILNIDNPLTVRGTIFNNGVINFNSQVKFPANGVFGRFPGGTINITGGSVTLGDSTTFSPHELSGPLTISAGGILNIYGLTFSNKSTLTNNGLIYNYTDFSNKLGATFVNSGTLTNKGSTSTGDNFHNYGIFTNETSGYVYSINNWVQNSGTLTNSGRFDFYGGTMRNGGTLINNNLLNINILNNDSTGIIKNSGSGIIKVWPISNGGAIDNDGKMINDSSGTIDVSSFNNNISSAVITNNGTIKIGYWYYGGGSYFSMGNSGTITNNGAINIYNIDFNTWLMATFFINAGTFTNNGTFTKGNYFRIYGGVFYNNALLINSAGISACKTEIAGGNLVLNTVNPVLPASSEWGNNGIVTLGPLAKYTLLTQPLTIEAGRTLNVEGILEINAVLTNNGVLNLNRGGEIILKGIFGPANIRTSTWPGGNFNWSDSSTITVEDNYSLTLPNSILVDSNRTLKVKQFASLTIPGGDTLKLNGTLSNLGTLNLNSGGNLYLNKAGGSMPGGTFNWDTLSTVTIGPMWEYILPETKLIEPGRSIDLFGKLTLHQGLNGSGIITIKNGGNLVLNSDPIYLPNVIWNSGGILSVSSNGKLTIGSNGFTIPTGATFINNGLITHNQGPGINIDSAGTFINNGILNNNSNSQISNKGTFTNSGTLNLAEFARMEITNSWPAGTFNWSPGSYVTISSVGILTLTDPLTIDSSRTLTNNGTLTNNSTLTINGELSNNNVFTNSGTLNLNKGGRLGLNSENDSFPGGLLTGIVKVL